MVKSASKLAAAAPAAYIVAAYVTGAAAWPGTPGIPAAALTGRTGHQTAPRTLPSDPAPQDTADVASSHTPD
jgi:hypothetical protein